MDPSKSSEKSGSLQPLPPAYPDQPGYPNPQPGIYPSTSGYPGQPVSPPQYGQGSYLGEQPITLQPMGYVAPAPLANPVQDYLGYSIFTMLCCCFPLGIAALIFSIFTRNANTSGQQQEAEKNSRTARILNFTALGIGIVFIVVYIIIIATSFSYIKP
ncbi:Synapse differentiation-inducing gene protein 1-like [Triplophysa tibetana]|uniref:Synapse differentiation-inducing gene protein 1-like n=1 Tax=Triplophysa tibetana TaxID=1572043 RepID=A0A5A9N1A6_9TELE|nr:Synapse differentiation-inducing gene protein 1-like [Triplophysa tibetana]